MSLSSPAQSYDPTQYAPGAMGPTMGGSASPLASGDGSAGNPMADALSAMMAGMGGGSPSNSMSDLLGGAQAMNTTLMPTGSDPSAQTSQAGNPGAWSDTPQDSSTQTGGTQMGAQPLSSGLPQRPDFAMSPEMQHQVEALRALAQSSYGQSDQLRNQAFQMTPPQNRGPQLGLGDLLRIGLPALLLSHLGPQQSRNALTSGFFQGAVGGKEQAAQRDFQNQQQQFQAQQQGMLGQAQTAGDQANRYMQQLSATLQQNLQQKQLDVEAYGKELGFGGKVQAAQIQADARMKVADQLAQARLAQTANQGQQGFLKQLNNPQLTPADKQNMLAIAPRFFPELGGLAPDQVERYLTQVAPLAQREIAQAGEATAKADEAEAHAGLYQSQYNVGPARARFLAAQEQATGAMVAPNVAKAYAEADNLQSMVRKNGILGAVAIAKANQDGLGKSLSTINVGLQTIASQANAIRHEREALAAKMPALMMAGDQGAIKAAQATIAQYDATTKSYRTQYDTLAASAGDLQKKLVNGVQFTGNRTTPTQNTPTWLSSFKPQASTRAAEEQERQAAQDAINRGANPNKAYGIFMNHISAIRRNPTGG